MSRLDRYLVDKGLTSTRSQAESYIKLGWVSVNGRVINKAGHLVDGKDVVKIKNAEQYVSRAALKLESVANTLGLDFEYKNILDVGSSTGGFTDYALKHGASRVVAVDIGSEQMHPSLRNDGRIDLREKTDIRSIEKLTTAPDIVVIDVSFISLREVLPHIATLASDDTQIVAMLKPQFEAGAQDINKGIIKNDTVRRRILHDFEQWAKKLFIISAKADSKVAGGKGNLERFYLLKKARA